MIEPSLPEYSLLPGFKLVWLFMEEPHHNRSRTKCHCRGTIYLWDYPPLVRAITTKRA